MSGSFGSLRGEFRRGIETLQVLTKQMEHTPDELATLQGNLNIVRKLMNIIDDRIEDDPLIGECQRTSGDAVSSLLQLKAKLETSTEGMGLEERAKILASGEYKEDIEQLQRSTDAALKELLR